MKLTDCELAAMADDPEALRLAAQWNIIKATEAGAIGDYPECVRYHEARAAELRAEADRIEAEY